MTAKKNGNDGRPRTKAKRVVFRVLWNPKERMWRVSGDGSVWRSFLKRAAVRDGVYWASRLHQSGVLTQLVIHNRDGRIESERTYGADPVRRKG